MFFLLPGCKKKESPVPPTTPGPSEPAPVPSECKKIPPPPTGFGWRDSLATPNTNVNAFLYNPLNGEEVIAVLNGELPETYKLVVVNLRTRNEKFLANIDGYLPSVNKKGWILFSGTDNNIYKIKTTGDSLRQLTNTNRAHDPKWNPAGTQFYYLHDGQGSIPARLNLSNSTGGTINSWPLDMSFFAPLHKSNRVVVQERTGNTVTLYLQDLDSNSRTAITSGNFDIENQSTPFKYVLASEDDTKLFWSNAQGIFRHELGSGKTDTLFKSCETVIYDRPMPGGLNEITFSKHVIGILEPVYLLHTYKTLEYNFSHGQLREVGIY